MENIFQILKDRKFGKIEILKNKILAMKRAKSHKQIIDDARDDGLYRRAINWDALLSLPPDARGTCGRTPLMIGAYFGRGHEDMLRAMLKMDRVDVNARKDSGWTALMYACYWRNYYSSIECVRILVNADGIDLEAQNKWGKTVLFYAGRSDECRELVQEAIERKREAVIKCKIASAMVVKSFRQLVWKDLAHLIGKYVSNTQNEKIWEN